MMNLHSATENATQNTDTNQALLLENSALMQPPTSATINQLRLAFATQKFLEIQARGGSRYIEVIKNHFNVTSPNLNLSLTRYLN